MLFDVPGYTGIEIRPGDYPGDTRGCILCGRARKKDELLYSEEAGDVVIEKIDEAVKADE